MNMVLAVAIGGGIGAAARYYFAAAIARLLGTGFPWGIMCTNILGSFIMGVLAEGFALKFDVSPEMRAFLTTGILGGFTTFSSFSLDAALLYERGDFPAMAAYVAGSVLLSILGLFLGLYVVRHVLG